MYFPLPDIRVGIPHFQLWPPLCGATSVSQPALLMPQACSAPCQHLAKHSPGERPHSAAERGRATEKDMNIVLVPLLCQHSTSYGGVTAATSWSVAAVS